MNPSAKTQNVREVTDSAFSPDTVPENHFHLGNFKYVVVSDFANAVRIHIREYELDGTGRVFPTEHGIDLSPLLWQSFTKKMEFLNMPNSSGDINIIENILMISTKWINEEAFVNLQLIFEKEDLTSQFSPSVCLLSKEQWVCLKQIRKDVTFAATCLLFGKIFMNLLRKEISAQTPKALFTDECSDIEIVLITSLLELLRDYLEENIQLVQKCHGCETFQGNPLAHECVAYNYERLNYYGDLAIFNMNSRQLVRDFVQKNAHIINYVNETFIANLNMLNLIEKAKEMYVATDPIPIRLS
ncbi:hypothetical protein AVEN_40776-1 [Araneus ventricosus]|uniref:Transcriptional coactivator p15 (PC4) C-terminal domain-containing protein n=1 Tax=Araneus ventricosus TaxID=182803 RepID=A0A4Y1ZNT5_ARAVE|nr:hypothetical protein AVEN_40776-1 [Araneus ventricosus]